MPLDFATLTSVKKVRNLQHENLPIQDINFPTKNSKSPDFGSGMYHMYASEVVFYIAGGLVVVLVAGSLEVFLVAAGLMVFLAAGG